MRRKPIIPMMRLKNSFDLKKLIYDNTPYGLCSFAEQCGIHYTTIYSQLRGVNKSMSFSKAVILADTLNVDIGLIFDFSQY